MEVPVAVAGWANHADTFMSLIDSYKTKELFCDCTLFCDRKLFRAHKMILAMSSELFENIFLATEDKNPVIILHEVEAWQVECLLNYMYKGETRVSDSHFISLCRAAKSLQIKGFDKLELYREAVKQSGKKDSRLIPKTEESRNENFFSVRPEEIPFSKGNSQLHDKDHLRANVTAYGLNNSNNQEVIKTVHHSPLNSPKQQLSPTSFSSPVVLSKEPSTSFEQDLSLKSHPQSEQSKSEEATTVSFSEKCNYRFSPTFNVKKKYLLSASQSQTQLQNPNSARSSPHEVIHSNMKSPTRRPDASNQAQEEPQSSSFTNSPKENPQNPSEARDDTKSVTMQKLLRDPPPLLRIMYNTFPEEKTIKSETGNATTNSKSEIQRDCTYEAPHNQANQQWFDNFLQLTLNSEPGNDPLLQKIPTNKRKRVRGPKSWEFLLRLLKSPESNPSLIKWENEEAGVFRLIRPEIIALRWGRRTGKHVYDVLSYESFSRGLRYHYATGALCAVSEKSFVYQFGPKAQHALQASKKMKPESPSNN